MKVVINNCFGGFGLSQKAYKWLVEHGMPVVEEGSDERGIMKFEDGEYFSPWLEDHRDDALLVEVVEALGEEVDGPSANELKVVEIPDNIEWQIGEYDGNEWVEEKHRKWN